VVLLSEFFFWPAAVSSMWAMVCYIKTPAYMPSCTILICIFVFVSHSLLEQKKIWQISNLALDGFGKMQ